MNYARPRPQLLYSYIATEMLAPFFASFIIMNCIFFLVKLIPFLDLVLEFDIQFSDFLRSIAYLFPNMLLYSIPMAAMMGIIIGFTRLSNDAEILAFKACGISIYNILPPVFMVSLVFGIFSAYVSIKLIPAGEVAMKQLFYQLTKEKIDKGIKAKQFTAALGDLVVYVDDVDRTTNEWKHVWVSDARDQKSPTITMAQTGRMSTNLETMAVSIDLYDGSLHRTDTGQNQIIIFKNYRVTIPVSLPRDRNTSFGLDSMSMKELREKADQFGVDTLQGRTCLVDYHKRIVLPFGCLIMSLMALPLGLQSGPGKRASGIPLGLAFFIIYYVLYTFGKILAEETTIVPVGISMWLANLFFLILTSIAIYRVANEKPLLSESLNDRILLLRQKVEDRRKDKKQKSES
jgi:lipopolysaccharide export system permease protein